MKNFLFVFLLLFIGVGVAQKPVPQLPQIYIDTTYAPPTGASRKVHNSDGLRIALDAAVPGDTIVLDAGVTYQGNFTLSAKANPNGKWIYIVSSALSSLPTPGNRVSPADAANMPKVVSTNVNAPLTFAQGANHYRLGGLEIYSISTQGCNPNTTPPTRCFGYTLVDSKTAIGHSLVDSITIDRCYIHGSPTIDVQRGVSLNGSNYAVIDSYVSDIHMHGSEVQAMAGWYTPGPIKIVNNYLSGAGQEILFGGAGGLNKPWVPSDIEIRNNHLHKPLSWAQAGVSIPPNNTMVVKNNFECKSCRRVLFDGNVNENSWVSGQTGFSIALTPRTNAIGGSGLLAVVDDITITNNVLKNVASGIDMLESDGLPNCIPANGCTSYGELKRVVIANNIILLGDTTQPGYTKADGWPFLLLPGFGGAPITDVVIQHNTVIPPPNLGLCRTGIYIETVHPWVAGSVSTVNTWILDNVFCRQIFGARGWIGSSPTVITDYMRDPAPVAPRFFGNVFYAPTTDKEYPLPPHNFSTGKRVENSNDGEYRLNYPAKMGTSDGREPGVDQSKLAAAYSAESGTKLRTRSDSKEPQAPKR